MATSTLEARLQAIGTNVQVFKDACDAAKTQATSSKHTLNAAELEAAKLKSAFDSVLKNINDVIPEFATDVGSLKNEFEEKFLALSSWESDIRTAFARATESLSAVNAVLASASPRRDEFILTVSVYYDGRGELFIRGEDAQVQLPPSDCATATRMAGLEKVENLSWDRGLPLTRLSDCLWETRLIVKEGRAPKYKFLISDCIWSEDPNCSPANVKFSDHVPLFDADHSSLLVPINVGVGNKLVIRGQGTVQIQGKEHELGWNKDIDLLFLRHNLWALPVGASGAVEFKLCVVKQSGEVVWEKDANRCLALGQEVVINPDFGPGVRKIKHSPAESLAFAPSVLAAQEKKRLRLESEQQQREAMLIMRPRPCLQGDGDTFKKEEIIKVNPPKRFEFVPIDGEDVVFQYTDNEKAIIIQAAPQGCTAGASAMLIVDNGQLPKLNDLKTRTAGNYKKIAEDITAAQLVPLSTPAYTLGRSMESLRNQILRDGPAYVRIQERAGAVGHAIIVDEISEDFSGVRIRDPWHGWEAIIKSDAFRQAWHRSLDQCETVDSIVQVRGGKK